MPDDTQRFSNWMRESGTLEKDPAALAANGAIYTRRADFGRFMGDLVATHQANNPSGSVIRHIQTRVDDLKTDERGAHLTLENGDRLNARQVILAVSNERPTVPAECRPIADQPAFFGFPWDIDALAAIRPEATVFIVGSGLTAADVIAVLIGQDHSGPITSVSRRGLLPQPQRGARDGPTDTIWERLTLDPPVFCTAFGRPATVRGILRALRSHIRQKETEDLPWQDAFDDLRDAARVLWPSLPDAEKARFVRHLRPWYETHRFRLPPQIETLLNDAVADGQLTFETGRLIRAAAAGNGFEIDVHLKASGEVRRAPYDVVINCTGPTSDPARSPNPLVQNLITEGDARPHGTGLGFAVDAACRAICRDGSTNSCLRIIGPLTRGQFGEVTAIPQIAWQISGMLPGLLADLDSGEA